MLPSYFNLENYTIGLWRKYHNVRGQNDWKPSLFPVSELCIQNHLSSTLHLYLMHADVALVTEHHIVSLLAVG